jgi:hypothetical protein
MKLDSLISISPLRPLTEKLQCQLESLPSCRRNQPAFPKCKSRSGVNRMAVTTPTSDSSTSQCRPIMKFFDCSGLNFSFKIID